MTWWQTLIIAAVPSIITGAFLVMQGRLTSSARLVEVKTAEESTRKEQLREAYGRVAAPLSELVETFRRIRDEASDSDDGDAEFVARSLPEARAALASLEVAWRLSIVEFGTLVASGRTPVVSAARHMIHIIESGYVYASGMGYSGVTDVVRTRHVYNAFGRLERAADEHLSGLAKEVERSINRLPTAAAFGGRLRRRAPAAPLSAADHPESP